MIGPKTRKLKKKSINRLQKLKKYTPDELRRIHERIKAAYERNYNNGQIKSHKAEYFLNMIDSYLIRKIHQICPRCNEQGRIPYIPNGSTSRVMDREKVETIELGNTKMVIWKYFCICDACGHRWDYVI